jgi:hypothetical protein
MLLVAEYSISAVVTASGTSVAPRSTTTA